MRRIFSGYGEALDNPVKIAERINVSLDVKGYHLPNFPVPEGKDLAGYFAEVARAGLERRLKSAAPLFAAKKKKYEPQADHDPLQRQIRLIPPLGFPGYF